MHVFHEPPSFDFDRVGVKGKLFPSQQLTDKAGFLLVETETGHDTTIIEHECLFAYYVLEGHGYFEIDDIQEKCVKGDWIVIPPGKKLTYEGKLKMLLVTTPAWREEQEEALQA